LPTQKSLSFGIYKFDNLLNEKIISYSLIIYDLCWMKPFTILAIESSCDDTAAAVIADGRILSNMVSTQLEHDQYGGVVPEVASRAHQSNILPVVEMALKMAETTLEHIDGVAVTQGPGLMGSLLVGINFAKSIALALDKPLIGVNHMEAHVMAHFIDEPKPSFPFLCLTVSGGHTQIVLVNALNDMKVTGSTIDDAAGEAFDKAGKLLGLGYPAGALIDKYAQLGEAVYKFPEPKIPDLNFSFSGLKTSIMLFIKKEMALNPNFIHENRNDTCASIQDRIVSILINKLKKAADQYQINQLGIAGGVSANSGLREALRRLCVQTNRQAFIPEFQYCTDNAAMIAMAAHYKYLNKDFSSQDMKPFVRNLV